MHRTTYTELTQEDRELLDAATTAMEGAYNPYSHFFVGAALRTLSGEIITGCNVENAAFASSICAERSAIVRAVAMGTKGVSAIAVHARGADFDTKDVTSPCGPCRQFIFEAAQIAGVDARVIMATTKKDLVIIAPISELLPLGFGPRELGVDVSGYRKSGTLHKKDD